MNLDKAAANLPLLVPFYDQNVEVMVGNGV